jgi:hypothetical protein
MDVARLRPDTSRPVHHRTPAKNNCCCFWCREFGRDGLVWCRWSLWLLWILELRRYVLLVDGCHGRVVGRGRPASRMEMHATPRRPIGHRVSTPHVRTRAEICSAQRSDHGGAAFVRVQSITNKQEEEQFVLRRCCGKRKEKWRWVRRRFLCSARGRAFVRSARPYDGISWAQPT